VVIWLWVLSVPVQCLVCLFPLVSVRVEISLVGDTLSLAAFHFSFAVVYWGIPCLSLLDLKNCSVIYPCCARQIVVPGVGLVELRLGRIVKSHLSAL
jgi:hypothetical protein